MAGTNCPYCGRTIDSKAVETADTIFAKLMLPELSMEQAEQVVSLLTLKLGKGREGSTQSMLKDINAYAREVPKN
jgi:hypothetical protein